VGVRNSDVQAERGHSGCDRCDSCQIWQLALLSIFEMIPSRFRRNMN